MKTDVSSVPPTLEAFERIESLSEGVLKPYVDDKMSVVWLFIRGSSFAGAFSSLTAEKGTGIWFLRTEQYVKLRGPSLELGSVLAGNGPTPIVESYAEDPQPFRIGTDLGDISLLSEPGAADNRSTMLMLRLKSGWVILSRRDVDKTRVAGLFAHHHSMQD